jgi:hypothetical protein
MRIVLAVAAVGEAAMGLALLADPTIVIQLLFGIEVVGAGLLVSRVAGIALIGLGTACWPSGSAHQRLLRMLAYGALVMLYLLYVGVGDAGADPLLWPAVVLHAIIVVLLVAAWQRARAVGRAGG